MQSCDADVLEDPGATPFSDSQMIAFLGNLYEVHAIVKVDSDLHTIISMWCKGRELNLFTSCVASSATMKSYSEWLSSPRRWAHARCTHKLRPELLEVGPAALIEALPSESEADSLHAFVHLPACARFQVFFLPFIFTCGLPFPRCCHLLTCWIVQVMVVDTGAEPSLAYPMQAVL